MKTAILLVVLLQFAIGAKLPDNFKRCHMKNPEKNSCLQEAVNDALRKIGTTGIPSLDVEPLQPMIVKEVKIDQGSKGPVAVKLVLTNLKIYGIPESNIESFGLSNNEIKAKALTPEFKLDADYVLDGQLLLLPIKGKGTCTITMESLTTYHDIKGKLVTRNGVTYLIFDKYEFDMRIQQMSLIFRNLFNGDKALGETLNKVMNDNWQLIFNELRPALEKGFGEVFLKYAKGIFDKVPYSDIFLE